MSADATLSSAAELYTGILKNSRTGKLPTGFPVPQPPAVWPAENVALLERYLRWLYADNAALVSIRSFYIPTAGHLLGYHLAPHADLDLDLAAAR